MTRPGLVFIEGGRVIDPAGGIDGPASVVVRDGVIAAIMRLETTNSADHGPKSMIAARCGRPTGPQASPEPREPEPAGTGPPPPPRPGGRDGPERSISRE